MYKKIYNSKIGRIVLTSDGEFLTGLWFEDSNDSIKHNVDCEEKNLKIFDETVEWLDIYFSGRNPDFIPKYKMKI